MSTNRLLVIVIAIALAGLASLTFRESVATRAITDATVQPSMDSATRSYIALGQALERSRLDSATRSYIAWGKALRCAPGYGFPEGLDSATRSYMAWGQAIQCGLPLE